MNRYDILEQVNVEWFVLREAGQLTWKRDQNFECMCYTTSHVRFAWRRARAANFFFIVNALVVLLGWSTCKKHRSPRPACNHRRIFHNLAWSATDHYLWIGKGEGV